WLPGDGPGNSGGHWLAGQPPSFLGSFLFSLGSSYREPAHIATGVQNQQQAHSTGNRISHAHSYPWHLRHLHGQPGDPGPAIGTYGHWIRSARLSPHEHATAATGD